MFLYYFQTVRIQDAKHVFVKDHIEAAEASLAAEPLGSLCSSYDYGMEDYLEGRVQTARPAHRQKPTMEIFQIRLC